MPSVNVTGKERHSHLLSFQHLYSSVLFSVSLSSATNSLRSCHPPPTTYNVGPLAVVALSVAALAVLNGATVAEAHFTHENSYYDIVLDVTDYELTEYNGFDLVRMDVTIENLAGFEMTSPMFVLGGAVEYVDDPLVNPGH